MAREANRCRRYFDESPPDIYDLLACLTSTVSTMDDTRVKRDVAPLDFHSQQDADLLYELQQFRTLTGDTVHRLNNLFTVLHCQWEFLLADTQEQGIEHPALQQMKQLIDEASELSRNLSIACAKCPPRT